MNTILIPGSGVAKFAGLNVHKRLVTEETYKNDDYEVALKKAFLGTDEGLLAGQFMFRRLYYHSSRCICRPCVCKRFFGLYGRCSTTHTR